MGPREAEFLTDPVEWWIEPFASGDFTRRALIAGLLAVVATSEVGTWVVLWGMSFLGDALAHGVLPGIAVAFLIGVDPTIGALAAALVMVAGINLIRVHSPLPDDTSIGVLLVGFLALAVVIMSSSGSYLRDLNGFLFGSITGVDDGDIARQAVAAATSVVGVVVGVLVSFHLARAPGATMALTSVVMFLVAVAVRAARRAMTTTDLQGLAA